MTVSLSIHSGAAIEPLINEIARLRIAVFRDFPYLYDGDTEYEARYLQTYVDSEETAVVIARDKDQIVGASTCLPLRSEEMAFQSPLREQGYNTEHFFYLAESVLMSDYRGQGLGVGFFRLREAHAAQAGEYTHTCFCAVQRPNDHPLKPANYQPLDLFWQHRGYSPAGCYASYSWKDVDHDTPTTKQLQFWIKKL